MQPTSPNSRRHPRPTSPSRGRYAPIPGFINKPRPQARPMEDMSIRELHDIYDRNARVLSQPAPSTSTYIPRLQREQTKIELLLLERGVDDIRDGMEQTSINGDAEADTSMNSQASPSLVNSPMSVTSPTQIPGPVVSQDVRPPSPQPILAKQRALAKFAAKSANSHNSFSIQEAVALEQEAHRLDQERKERLEEKRKRHGHPIEGETRQQREARIWAFMNHKPTESDMEDDDEEDSDDDPANWFVDDQEDGIKGQDIIEPDDEGLEDVIRIDQSRVGYSTFYEPREEGDV